MNDKYFNILDLEYNKLPKDVSKLLNIVLKTNKSEVLNYQNKSFVSVITLSKNVFSIHELITQKEYRNKGFGTKLMNKVHRKYNGLFIVKTITAKRFYEKLGYKYIGKNIFIFINKDLFDRRFFI